MRGSLLGLGVHERCSEQGETFQKEGRRLRVKVKSELGETTYVVVTIGPLSQKF